MTLTRKNRQHKYHLQIPMSSSTYSTAQMQFNDHKFSMLMNRHQHELESFSPHQKLLALDILKDLCWARNIDELSSRWQQRDVKPDNPSSCLTLLHFNIFHFYSNQTDLVSIVQKHSPTIISINELGTAVLTKTIKQSLFSYNIYRVEGTNSHGGVVLAIDKKVPSSHVPVDQPNFVAAQILVNGTQLLISSIYSPSHERLPLSEMTKRVNDYKNIIFVGDLNAKHADWECPQINPHGTKLAAWLNETKLNVLNSGMITSLRSDTTIDLIISNIIPEATENVALPYRCSDHFPIVTKFLEYSTTNNKRLVPRTYWNLFPFFLTVLQVELSESLNKNSNGTSDTFGWFQTLERLLSALKSRITKWAQIDMKRPSIPQSLRVLLKHKHYLQNRYRHNKTEENRLRLRTWNSIIMKEFKAVKKKNWEDFIANIASPDPSAFWSTVKKLNKKKSTNFQGICENNKIHRSSNEIIDCLTRQFAERYTPTPVSTDNHLDNQATELWNLLTLADLNDIGCAMSQSDFNVNKHDVKICIRSLKNKSSASFDNVSNKMIKLMPDGLHQLLALAYNRLFQFAFWGDEWKRARVICLNKTDKPTPSTNQLRPISILPAFSKIYERLFLKFFNIWVMKNNIIPPQQSGATQHQSTTSRVNFLLEQLYQAERISSFTPVVYVDFLQAFDLLWPQGLILKLQNLGCPFQFLLWLANYFKHRSIRIKYEEVISPIIEVSRGTTQVSVLGPILYVICHHDLPTIFQTPVNVHAYVDDICALCCHILYLR